MEKSFKSIVFLCAIVACYAAESPSYTVVHEESDFEVRLYGESTWMFAPVRSTSFEKATFNGFHRLFQFIQGANLNYSRIPIAYPLLTRVTPEARPLQLSAYPVLLYLPAEFQADPPVPLPELNLKPHAWGSHCIAVSKFSGRARNSKVVQEAEKLASSLSRSPWANATSASKSGYAYSVAQYHNPFWAITRINEVWIDVDVSGCRSTGIAAY